MRLSLDMDGLVSRRLYVHPGALGALKQVCSSSRWSTSTPLVPVTSYTLNHVSRRFYLSSALLL